MALTKATLFSDDPLMFDGLPKASAVRAFDAILSRFTELNRQRGEQQRDLGEAQLDAAAQEREMRVAAEEDFLERRAAADDEFLRTFRASGSQASATTAASMFPEDVSPVAAGATDAGPSALPASLTDLVKGFEGFYENAYDDYAQVSIGYGTRAKPGEKTITREEAERRLAAELATHRRRVVEHAKRHGYQFTNNQLDALTSFDYNTGRLEQLTDQGRRTPEQIAAMMPAYRKAGGQVLPGLVKRRKAERDLFLR